METRRSARRRSDAALRASPLLHGLLLDGAAVFEAHVAPRLSNLALAALAAACKAGRAYRRERVAGGEQENLLRINKRDAVRSVGELRAALALGLGLDLTLVKKTAEYGSTEALAWLLDNTEVLNITDGFIRYFVKTEVWLHAACSDSERVEKLEALLQRIPRQWNKCACTWAARYGHMDALRWLHEHGAPWGENTCFSAAKEGHLEALQYAVSRGCEWHPACLSAARRDNHAHVVAWIQQLPAEYH